MLNLMTASVASVDFISQMGILVVMFAVLYFVTIRPQRKKEKEQQAMRSAIEIGDEVITIGGIIGIVIGVKEDTLVIETGSDRSKVRIAKWAIQTKIVNKEEA